MPIPLTAEPSGAEFAYPEKEREEAALAEHPDPEGKVPLDRDELVKIEGTAVPSTKTDSPAFRVHLKCVPNARREVHWTNDAGPLSFFPDPHEAYEIRHFQGASRPLEVLTSSELRRIEFELRPKDGSDLPKFLSGSAYYYVCEDVDGQCLFLRQRVRLPLETGSAR